MSFTGTVKSFGADKGFGFIHNPMPDGPDIFVHLKACTDGMVPQQGDTLTFDVEESQTKAGQMVAANVSGGTGTPGAKGGGKGMGKPPGAMCGTVKTYNQEKQFGFIVGPDGADVFMHANAITDGSVPQQGDYVSYDCEPSKSKPGQMVAQNVQGGTGVAKGKGKGGWGDSWGGDSWGGKGGGGKGGAGQLGGCAPQGPVTPGANVGQVKSFNPMKGFGFITTPEGQEVFFHQAHIVDLKTPQAGDALTFDMEPSRTKEGQMIAKNIAGGTGAQAPAPTPAAGKGNGKDSWGGDSWGGGGWDNGKGGYGAAKGDSWDGGKGGPYGGDKGNGKGDSWGDSWGGKGGDSWGANGGGDSWGANGGGNAWGANGGGMNGGGMPNGGAWGGDGGAQMW